MLWSRPKENICLLSWTKPKRSFFSKDNCSLLGYGSNTTMKMHKFYIQNVFGHIENTSFEQNSMTHLVFIHTILDIHTSHSWVHIFDVSTSHRHQENCWEHHLMSILSKSIIKSICIATDGEKWFKTFGHWSHTHSHEWCPNWLLAKPIRTRQPFSTASKLINDWLCQNKHWHDRWLPQGTQRTIDTHACARVNTFTLLMNNHIAMLLISFAILP